MVHSKLDLLLEALQASGRGKEVTEMGLKDCTGPEGTSERPANTRINVSQGNAVVPPVGPSTNERTCSASGVSDETVVGDRVNNSPGQ